MCVCVCVCVCVCMCVCIYILYIYIYTHVYNLPKLALAPRRIPWAPSDLSGSIYMDI